MMRETGREGFTLVELLVAIALLALMAGYAAVVLGQMGRTRDIEARIAREAEVDAVVAYLHRAIESAKPLVTLDEETAGKRMAFEGEAASLSLVTDGDRRLEPGGLHLAEFFVDESRSLLVTRRKVYRPDKRAQADAAPATVQLLNRVKRISFRYYGAARPGEPAGWSMQWSSSETLPRLIEVTLDLHDDEGRRPAAMVALPLSR